MNKKTRDIMSILLLFGALSLLLLAVVLDRWYAVLPLVVLFDRLINRWLPPFDSRRRNGF